MPRTKRKRSRTNQNQAASAPAVAPPERGWCFPRPVQRFADKLLTQQVWCWGRDIEYVGGNLLIRYGCVRHRPPRAARQSGSTCYRLDDGQRHLALWGFGLFYGERRLGGLYVNRFRFQPVWSAVESLSLGIHWSDDLPPFARPSGSGQWERAHRLCRNMMEWIAGYERWVRREAGLDYRNECIAEWLHPFVAADQVPAAWRVLGGRIWETDPDGWKERLQSLAGSVS